MAGPKRLKAVLLALLLVVSAFAGTVAFSGSAAAAHSLTVDVFDPSSVDESTTETHTLNFTVDATDAQGTSNETYVIDIPSEGTRTGHTISVSNTTGDTATLYNQSSSANRIIFDTNRSWTGPGNTSETLWVNMTVTVDWGTVSSQQTPDFDIAVTEHGTTQTGTATVTINNVQSNAASRNDSDANLDSGETFWQGQELFFDGSNVISGNDRTFQVRRWDSGDEQFGGLDTEFVVNDTTNTALIDTEDLDGEYVLVYDGSGVTVNDNGVATGTVTESNSDSASWEVATQSLSASFDEDDLPVTTGESATIEMDSNRGSYVVNVSAGGLDEGDLEEIFNQSDSDGEENDVVDDSVDDGDDDESIQINTTSDGEIEANFSVFDEAGPYTFDFEVSDTTVTASATVEVTEEDTTLDFDQSVYTQQEGDVVDVTVQMEDTDEAYIYIGSEDVNYFERVHVVDDNEDGEVTLTINTFRVGRAPWVASDGKGDNESSTGDAGAYQVGDDDEFGSSGDSGVKRYNSTDFNDELDITQNLTSPWEPGDYDLVAASEAHVGYDDSDDDLLTDDNDLTIPSEEAVATLDLTARSTNGVSTWVAPDDDYDDLDDDEFAELLNDATESSDVAVNDLLIVQVDASGIFGYLNDSLTDDQIDDLTDPDTGIEGAYLTIAPVDSTNRGGSAIDDLGSSSAVYTDEENDLFYLVIDTRTADIEDGDEMEVNFRVGDEDASNSPNPYVDDEEEELVEAEFSAADAEAEFDNVDDDTLSVAKTEEATVSGTTNLAPNSEITVRLRRSADPAFLMTQEEVVVQEDGTWSTTFDMSDIALETEFTATVRAGGTTISDQVDAIVVEQVAAATPETTSEPPETTASPDTTTEGETTSEGGMTTEPPAGTTTESDGQPGFGVAIALVALLAAALLAVRRHG